MQIRNVTNTTAVWIQLAPQLSDSQLVAIDRLSTALADSCLVSTIPLPFCRCRFAVAVSTYRCAVTAVP